jgi:hypothetical protein
VLSNAPMVNDVAVDYTEIIKSFIRLVNFQQSIGLKAFIESN